MYADGSLAGQAFEAALTVPRPEAIDWGRAAAEYAKTEVLPTDDLERFFPVGFVMSWFERADHPVDEDQARSAASQLRRAQVALFVDFALSRHILTLSYGTRSRDGVAKAVRANLKDISSTAARLRDLLADFRGELLHRRSTGIRDLALENLHALLHSSCHYGQERRQAFEQGGLSAGEQPFDPLKEVGPRATLAPTWLEDGLTLLAESALEFIPAMPSERAAKTDPAKAHRESFIRTVATVWESATDSPATKRGDRLAVGKSSAFQTFHQAVCGHTCGLLARDRAVSRERTPKTGREQLKVLAKRLGLAPVPSASALRRALDGTSI